MIKISDVEKCCGCGACIQKCPQKCIDFILDNEGFYYPQVRTESCINCGICERVCPFGDSVKQNKMEPIETWASYAKDRDILINSSSGGIFSLLAKCVLEQEGIVYGTGLSEDCRSAIVVAVEDMNELNHLRGSKYLQSLTRKVFIDIQFQLSHGRYVLFSGTPCQVSALKLFLGKDYKNLICIDIICHGVPSPKLWTKYINYMEMKHRLKVVGVNFRCKDECWKKFRTKENHRGKNVFINRRYDTYMQMFSRNYCLRPSCYKCKAKSHNMADITLGDFWGIERVLPQMNGGLGTSLVIVRSIKGKELFEKISKELRKELVNYLEAVKDNEAEYKSVDRPIERDAFFTDMNSLEYKDLFMKYLYSSKKLRLKKRLIDIRIWKIFEKIRGYQTNNLQYGLLFQMELQNGQKNLET